MRPGECSRPRPDRSRDPAPVPAIIVLFIGGNRAAVKRYPGRVAVAVGGAPPVARRSTVGDRSATEYAEKKSGSAPGHPARAPPPLRRNVTPVQPVD